MTKKPSIHEPSKYAFRGLLEIAKPTYPHNLARKRKPIEDASSFREHWEADARENERQMLELMDFYSINSEHPDCWQDLAYKLAFDHVPGFSVAKKRGPKKDKYQMILDALLLYRYVIEIKREKGWKNYSRAIQHIYKNKDRDERYKKYRNYTSERSLRTTFDAAKKKVFEDSEYKEGLKRVIYATCGAKYSK